MKKYLLPIGIGVAVFGAVTAFAASLTVNSSSLGAGNATVGSCNSSAAVSYDTVGTTATKTYKVTTATVTTPAVVAPATSAVCGGMSFKVTLLGASNVVLGELPGTLDNLTGVGSVDFSSSNVPAVDVTGVAVVITG